MEQLDNGYEPFLPDLAKQVAIWFPELGGRSLAVSEAVLTKTNIGTLPLVMVAFTGGISNEPNSSRKKTLNLTDTFVIEFMLDPLRYKRNDNSETPFWSFYDYAAIRNTLLANTRNYQGPNGERIAYQSLTPDVDEYAVIFQFRFSADYQWCADEFSDVQHGNFEEDGHPPVIATNLCIPHSKYCGPEFAEKEDPCP